MIRFHLPALLLLLLSAILFSPSQLDARQDNPRFTILHTNDEHSTLLPAPMVDYHPELPSPAHGGFARVATEIKRIRAEKRAQNEPVLLFSGGDILGGSPFAWLILNGFTPEINLLQKIGYDAWVIGNHEFDYGPEILAEYLKKAGYPGVADQLPFLGTNFIIPENHPLSETGIKKTHLIELENGLTLGLFGLLGKDAVSVAPYTDPITFEDQHESARRAVTELQENGADVIIALTHSGVPEDIALAEDVAGIHLIVGGHDHVALHEPVIANGTIIVQSGYYLQNLGRIELEFDRESRSLSILNDPETRPFLIPMDDSIPEDPEIAGLIQGYRDELNTYVAELTDSLFTDIGEVIVYAEQHLTREPALSETQVGNFATDAMRIISEQATSKKVDLAFQGNGVLRADIQPGTQEWSEGAVSFLDLVTIAGLGTGPDLRPGYPIVSVYLTGEEIYRVMEISSLLSQYLGNTYFLQISGMRVTYDPARSILFRVPFSGTPIPTYRSVFDIEMFTGEGMQRGDDFSRLEKDDRLYHVISDYYVASFMPMIGELLPNLELTLKNEMGEPIGHIDEAVVHRNGQELKVWQTLAEYAATFSTIPDEYHTTGSRLIEQKGFPLIVWPILGLVVVILLLFWLFRWIMKRRRKARAV